MMKVLIAAFYSNEFYRQQSLRLTASLDALGIRDYTVTPVGGKNTWNEAVSHKPRWIRGILDALDGYDGLFYVDADAEFKRKPDWEVMKGCDFACVEWKRYPTSEPEQLTGSMFFSNSDRVREFVDEWDKLTPKYQHTYTPEQRSLAEYFETSNDLKVLKLPLGWCRIFDDMKAMVSDEETIIEQWQASREYKDIEAKAKREGKTL